MVLIRWLTLSNYCHCRVSYMIRKKSSCMTRPDIGPTSGTSQTCPPISGTSALT